MSDLVLRLARPGEDARIADFINQNFDMRLPLILSLIHISEPTRP